MATIRIPRPNFLTPLWSALLALALLAIAPAIAEAQSVCVTSRGNCSAGYAPPGAGCYCHIPGFGRKAGNVAGGRYGYDDEYVRPRPRYRERPVYEDEGFQPYPRRRAMGSVCVTSRGECSAGRMVPIMTGCYCHIPGFGRKAGNVRY